MHSRAVVPVRLRLLALALLPMGVVLPLLLALAVNWGSAYLDRLLIARVKSDLVTAHEYFNRVSERIGGEVRAVGRSAAFARVSDRGGRHQVNAFLAAQRDALGLDFLSWVDARGRVIASSNPGALGDDAERWPIVRDALEGRARTAVDIFSAAELQRLSPNLATQARLDLVATDGAAPSARTRETRGMLIHAAAPLPGGRGEPEGVLVGGQLLNQNLGFVDNINSLVYTEGSLPAGSHGTATLFLDDVRIATNVRLFGDARALGTRVSQVVQQHVLGRGETWLARAFVVNNWYVSAYEPLTDSYGRRVGMLYVGFLEAPYATAQRNLLLAIVALFLFAAALLTPFFLRWARGIFRPLERMNDTISAIESGRADARTGETGSHDEIGRVATHLDELLDRLQDRERELRAWGEELDAKVAARTSELEAAQRQLAMSEKLAAIGELTAGVAHEINNPVAVIQGNLDLARELLGAQAAVAGEEFRLIDQQLERINVIVNKLLQFARPTEFAGYAEPVDVAEVIGDSLVLIRHLLGRGHIAVEREDHAEVRIRINRTELQQVLINLMVNAVHAMPEGGTLRLVTRDWPDGPTRGVAIEVADTGCGIAAEHQERIFDAFYSTKREHGTGLGLSISYTLVARYGGRITVRSAPDAGASFTVWLPAD